MIHILNFRKFEKKNFKINVISKPTEKYMSFSIQQPKEKYIKSRFQVAFIDSVHF